MSLLALEVIHVDVRVASVDFAYHSCVGWLADGDESLVRLLAVGSCGITDPDPDYPTTVGKDLVDASETQDDQIPVVPRELVEHPAAPDSYGKVYAVCCTDDACQWRGDLYADPAYASPAGKCPACGQALRVDFSRHNWGIAARGPGYHSTAWGRRRKQDLIRRSEKMATKQWDNVDPGSVVNPERVVNPTSGGVYDPNSKFNKHKNVNKKIIY